MSEALLTVTGLKTQFQTDESAVNAVDDVSFFIEEGEVLGLVGESGSGKSVTALSLLRLVDSPGKIVAGEIILQRDGGPINCLTIDESEMRSIRGRDIAMIFQEPMTSLNPVYTIGNQIGEALTSHSSLERAKKNERILAALKQVQIPDVERVAKSYPHELSGGMRQRAMIAMAIVCKPRLLLVDEATTALDVTIQAQILDLLKSLQKKLNMAMLFITHDLGVLAQIADRLMVMKEGKIVEQGKIDVVFKSPKHSYTKMLLAAVPRFREN
jgi:ABC-type dipeptide/oligopeptide/nickel transport system ATPase component